MPSAQEHRKKYQDNKEVLNSVFDYNNRLHCNWIVTISFYIALHIIEAKLSARYSNNDMVPTIANQMKRFAEEIEAEVFPAQEK